MKVGHILSQYGKSEIKDAKDYKKIPGIYLIKFTNSEGYVGQSNNVGRRVKEFRASTPLSRHVGKNTSNYPVYFLRKVSNKVTRKRMERSIVQRFRKVLNNIEYTRPWEQRNKKSSHRVPM